MKLQMMNAEKQISINRKTVVMNVNYLETSMKDNSV